MKDQAQQPMAPTTYYPSWQTDGPHQGWPSQFMQHIPAHTSSSMDFTAATPQSYPYSTNGCVQNGIVFDPNYSRPYGGGPTNVQSRYDYAEGGGGGGGNHQLGNYAAPVNPLTGLTANASSAAGFMAPNGHEVRNAAESSSGPAKRTFGENSDTTINYGEYGGTSSPSTKSAANTATAETESVNQLAVDSRALSPPNHQQQPNYEVAGGGGGDWDWTSEKIYRCDKSKNPEDDFNAVYFTNSHHAIKKEGQSPKSDPTKTNNINQFDSYNQKSPPSLLAKDQGAAEKTIQHDHDRNLLSSESQKYSPFNHHQSYFNMYYPAYGMAPGLAAAPSYTQTTAAAVPPNDLHAQPPPPSLSFHKPADGKDKKLYHDATSANSLLAGNESIEDGKNATAAAAYDKSRKESKLYQPQLNLHSDADVDNRNSSNSNGIGEGPTKDCNNINALADDAGESGKRESFATPAVKHHQQPHGTTAAAIKEEPIDNYYHHSVVRRDYQPQNSYFDSYANGHTEPDRFYHHHPEHNAMAMASKDAELEKRLNGYDVGGELNSSPVICPTNFEKDIPAHTYQIPGRLNDEMSHYGKLANGIKPEPDYNSDSMAHNEHYYNGTTDDKKLEPIETDLPVEKHPSPPETPIDRTEKAQKPEVPDCDCFSSEKSSPEPGSYYTHLGSATSLAELRTDFETRFNIRGRQLRIEKVLYTGKEGKTGQGCPLAKWIIRRTDQEEKVLCIVKKRQGHRCAASFLIICIVVWDGIPKHEADDVYKLLVHKLNKFGLPTTRRCATNENRTCACQGLDPETSGASYSFGCSWSMYYNGCKYARSKTVRKFRLSVKSEEAEIEERMNYLATMLAPLYERATPKAYENQCKYEQEALDCRLGFHNGKPFSGVTACLDFCAHAHRDLHNMQDGCTVQVALLRNRHPNEEPDEQLHILPLYVMDTTDETGSSDGQKEKNNSGGVQSLEKFPCEVRIRSTPLQPCRRHGKKRNGKDGEEETAAAAPTTPVQTNSSSSGSSKKESSKSSKSSKQSAAKGDSSAGQSNSKSPGASQSPRSQTPSTTTAQNSSSAFVAPNSQYAANGAAGVPPGGSATAGGQLQQVQQAQHVGGTAAATTGNGGGGNAGGQLNPNSNLVNMASMIDTFTEAQAQLQNSRHNYYNHPAVHHPHHHHQPQHIQHHPPPPPPPHHHPQWPDFNNNHNNTGNPAAGPPAAFDNSSGGGGGLSTPKHRVGLEENPDSTSVAANNNHLLYNGFGGGAEAVKPPSDVDLYFKPKASDYPLNHHHQSHTSQGSSSYSSMYPPAPPHHHHHPHHHPGFGEHHQHAAAYQQNYDYRYNYAPYANQAFHHPYPAIYSPSTYSAPHHGWNAMYSAAPTSSPASAAVLSPSPHGPVSGGNASPFGGAAFNNQMLPLTPPATVIKTETVPKVEPIGEVQEVNDNVEAFQDAQMGGIGIALGHGSVLFECAKHEMHATSALKLPNRTHPNRIALIFYQHRNLNRPKHGTEEWEEKMRQKKNNQEVENRLLKSIKEEAGAESANHTSTAASGSGSSSSSKKGSKTKVEPMDVQEAKQDVSSLQPQISQPMPVPLAPPVSVMPAAVAPSMAAASHAWAPNFAMGHTFPMAPYHHPHHHHHMLGPMAKSSLTGSPTKTLST